MNAKLKAMKANLEKTLSQVAGISVEITFARLNMITISWEGEMIKAFERLQKYFKGQLFDYEYDKECDMSVCCLKF